MKAFLQQLFIFGILFTTGQALAQEPVKLFYTEDWLLTKKNSAAFYREAQLDTALMQFVGEVKDFSESGMLKMSGSYKNGQKHGLFTFYYPNGEIAAKGNFLNNQAHGLWQYFYKNGKTAFSLVFSGHNSIVNSFNDEDGNTLIVAGTGEWEQEFTMPGIDAEFKLSGTCEDGKRTGTWLCRYKGGRKAFKIEYEDNLPKEIVLINKPLKSHPQPYDIQKVAEKVVMSEHLLYTEKLETTEALLYDRHFYENKYSLLNYVLKPEEEITERAATFPYPKMNIDDILMDALIRNDYYLKEELNIKASFIVNEAGIPENVKILENTYSGNALSEPTLNVLAVYDPTKAAPSTPELHQQNIARITTDLLENRLPYWLPAIKNGKAVATEVVTSFKIKPFSSQYEYVDAKEAEYVEKLPEFPGGNNAFFEYLGKNIRYPREAKEKNIRGVVYVEFIILEDGTTSDFQILADPGGGLGQEAVRVLKSAPKWEPGTQNGIPVKVKYKVPIKFSIQNGGTRTYKSNNPVINPDA